MSSIPRPIRIGKRPVVGSATSSRWNLEGLYPDSRFLPVRRPRIIGLFWASGRRSGNPLNNQMVIPSRQFSWPTRAPGWSAAARFGFTLTFRLWNGWCIFGMPGQRTRHPLRDPAARCASPCRRIDAVQVHHARGGLTQLDDFAPLVTPLTFRQGGGKLDLAARTGKCSTLNLPFFNLEMGNGGVLGAIGWTGGWSATFTAPARRHQSARRNGAYAPQAAPWRRDSYTPRSAAVLGRRSSPQPEHAPAADPGAPHSAAARAVAAARRSAERSVGPRRNEESHLEKIRC